VVVELSKIFRSGFEKIKKKTPKSRSGAMNGGGRESGQLVVKMESAKAAVLRKTPPKRWIKPLKRRKAQAR
jgi:hypothetical protein